MGLKKHIILLLTVLSLANLGYAHEPLYGLGPETLPKHLSAVELGTRFGLGDQVYELGYGFGITENWTVRLDVPGIQRGTDFGMGNAKFRIKYALWRKTQPGVLKRLTAIAVVSMPTTDRSIGLAPDLTATTLGIANGYESRRWYYFSDIGYTLMRSGSIFQPGNKFSYNLVGGIRPVKSGYLKPDLVLLIELNGELSGKAHFSGTEISQSGGNTLAVAPGFLFSYRNIMLKAGMQFGVANTANVVKPEPQGLVSLEYHF